jgi:NAD(P)-dependent dehydrogenase (short-subunit alcohol dehydrogenase family)
MANILITGAARGIGFELTRQYAAAGDRVFACCRNPAKADALNALAAASGGKVTVHDVDLGDPATIEATARALAGTPIDVLINNAGVTGGEQQSLADTDFDEWIETLKINTLAPVRVAKAFQANLKQAKGKVLNVTSQLGASTWPFGGMYAYSTSKAALNKVTQLLALDWKGDGISVGVVHPGWVRTEMGGPQADISPEESASGIRNVIANLSPDNTGGFFKWNGERHAW